MRFIKTLKSRNGRPIDFKKIEGKLKRLAEDFNVDLIYIYGSYAFGVASKLSDLDIGFLAHKALLIDERLSLMEGLQVIFEEEAVDLVDLRDAPLTLIHRVLKEGRCLYASSLPKRIDFETRCENLYLDAEPLRREYERALIRRIENGTFGHR